MNQIQNTITTVIGHKGYGKTALTERLMIETGKATIIADPRFQYQSNSARRLNFRSVSDFRHFITKNYQVFKKYKLELVVNAFDDTFEELAKMVAQMKNITFVIDEIDMFFDTRADKKSAMYKLVHYGRHNKIDIITTSRRPANISRNLTSQTDIFYFSKLREPNDKDYIKKAIGGEYVGVVEKLERFSFLKIEDEKTSIFKTTIKDLEALSL